MAIIKCRMCGGDISLSKDRCIATCQYCGSVMTLPRVSDEQRLNLFNMADRFRRQGEFDKAVAAYEKILEQDDTDAEAHWGAALSRYGIEYVEDPATHRRVPTCHRMQPVGILADEDYRLAITHASNAEVRAEYVQQAQCIADIQRNYQAISAREAPCDVFICYKESDDRDQRTPDSALAQDIYDRLMAEGFKVFFSRISLEDRLGQEYEPYIYAALSSARVMLVVGTRREYLDAAWVRNEWSRFLERMKQDKALLLIPCYRDMSAKELPEALAPLQSQDMIRPGAQQDLVHIIKKALKRAEADAGVSPLLERAFICLEDGEFDKADGLCEQALNSDPRNGRAYLGKLMARFGAHRPGDLARLSQSFEDDGDFKKLMRFGDEDLKRQVLGCIDAINARNLRLQQAEEARRARTRRRIALLAVLSVFAVIVFLAVHSLLTKNDRSSDTEAQETSTVPTLLATTAVATDEPDLSWMDYRYESDSTVTDALTVAPESIEPTPVQTPIPTPIPQELYIPAMPYTDRLPDPSENGVIGITQCYISAADGNKVLYLAGFGYIDDERFDSAKAETYLLTSATNSNDRTLFYKVALKEGVSGNPHTTAKCKNAASSDFEVYIDVSNYPGDIYSLTLAIMYQPDGSDRTYTFVYPFSNDVNFQVMDGKVIRGVNVTRD